MGDNSDLTLPADDKVAGDKLSNLIEKCRAIVKQLGIHLKVHNPEKLLNILIMNQQLNIIEPSPIQIMPGEPAAVSTIKDVLKPPMNSELKQIQTEELTAEKEKEIDDISLEQKGKAIEDQKKKLGEERNKLKQLRANLAEEKKNFGSKRKLQQLSKSHKGKQLIVLENVYETRNVKRSKRCE